MKAFSLFIDKKQKQKNFFEKPNNQKLKTKQNVNFPAPPILNIFFQKFHGLVLHTRSSWADFIHGLLVHPQGCQGCQKIKKDILQINLLC